MGPLLGDRDRLYPLPTPLMTKKSSGNERRDILVHIFLVEHGVLLDNGKFVRVSEQSWPMAAWSCDYGGLGRRLCDHYLACARP